MLAESTELCGKVQG